MVGSSEAFEDVIGVTCI